MEKKKDNNNSFLEKATVFFTEPQQTLFDSPVLKPQFKLKKHQARIMELFYLNSNAKITRNGLQKWTKGTIHINTISNFLKSALSRGFIEKLSIRKGAVINTMMQYYKAPDTFEDGSIVPDIRATYYQITKLGEEVWKLNQKELRE